MTNPKSITVLAAVATCAAVLSCGGGDSAAPITGDVTVTLTMKELPAQLPINQAMTPDGRFEYRWDVAFDVNGSRTLDEGDLVLRLQHRKLPNAPETMVAANEMEAALWSVGAFVRLSFVSAIPVEVVDNTIRLVVDRPAFVALGDIATTTRVNFASVYYDNITDGY